MEALADPNTHLVGVYGSDDEIKDTLLQRVYRRVQRDQLFGVVVTAKVTKYPDVKKIQEDIACQLAFTFNHMSKEKRSKELIRRIKNEHNILIVLCDLQKALDLNNIGIPYGANHTGCKILLTSTAEDVLSHHMHTQTNFMV
ncbi:probable disease resistance protein At5g47260 [Neltuma alba]|uniref:probable disease resistance protein At5g47260 n=1 Tax=Neltuma alba TaxID=207710 RepID=UPI0010A38AB3|nr:probable disease resistance protein At5g47260 [Prosopis alba]